MVLASSDRAEYRRLPILLTGDFAGAARLMQRLARTLQVPYLFCGDAAGWKMEETRAKNRPPLRSGGIQERDAARLSACIATVVGNRSIRPCANELPAKADRAETPRLVRRRRRRRVAEDLARVRSLTLDSMYIHVGLVGRERGKAGPATARGNHHRQMIGILDLTQVARREAPLPCRVRAAWPQRCNRWRSSPWSPLYHLLRRWGAGGLHGVSSAEKGGDGHRGPAY